MRKRVRDRSSANASRARAAAAPQRDRCGRGRPEYRAWRLAMLRPTLAREHRKCNTASVKERRQANMAEASLSATKAALENQPRAARSVASVPLDTRFSRV